MVNNHFYHTQIWFPKSITRQEFGSHISINIVDKVIEVDELNECNIWKRTFGGTRPLVPNRSKQGQTGSNGAIWGQTGPNEQTGPNRAKWGSFFACRNIL